MMAGSNQQVCSTMGDEENENGQVAQDQLTDEFEQALNANNQES